MCTGSISLEVSSINADVHSLKFTGIFQKVSLQEFPIKKISDGYFFRTAKERIALFHYKELPM